jgi:hypothetical protein
VFATLGPSGATNRNVVAITERSEVAGYYTTNSGMRREWYGHRFWPSLPKTIQHYSDVVFSFVWPL